VTRILAIHSSYRGDQGHTRFLLDRLGFGACQEGADFEVVSMAKVMIQHCLTCDHSHTQEHFLQCLSKDRDDVWMIFSSMPHADILVYATLVDFYGLSGLVKAFLDRMYGMGDANDLQLTRNGLLFHHVDRSLCSIPFVLLICCDNLETEITRNIKTYFHTFSRFMDAPQVGELVCNGGRLAHYGRKPVHPAIEPRLNLVNGEYTQADRELTKEGHIRPATQCRVHQEIVPVPRFGLPKHLPPFKRGMIVRPKEMLT